MHVAPGGPYPPEPAEHPGDHLFQLPNGGRILDAYQMVYLSAGTGTFESKHSGARRVEAGAAFLLFPSVWHRYAPEPDTGWTEYFVELRGPMLDRLLDHGIIRPDRPFFDLSGSPGFLEQFQKLHHYALDGGAGNREVMATLGIHLVAQALQSERNPEPSPENRAVRQAELRIRQDLAVCPNLEAMAEELGIGYDRFRRRFKALTGLAPKQYHRKLQMRRAEEMLLNTPRSLAEIAEELGFSSPFHLSAAFKEHSGQSPLHWKERRKGADGGSDGPTGG
jgi:AraC-like DNA-binding protein